MKTTSVKVVASVFLFVIVSLMIALMKNAHIFGKTFLVIIMVYILKLIWTKSDNQKQTNTSLNSKTHINLSQQKNAPKNADINSSNISNDNITYNGGHNSDGHSTQTTKQSIINQEPEPLSKKNGEFGGSNPYAKN